MNFSIKIRWLIALLAGAMLTSGVATAADAIDVKNVADPVRHPYQQTASVQCAPDTCMATFRQLRPRALWCYTRHVSLAR